MQHWLKPYPVAESQQCKLRLNSMYPAGIFTMVLSPRCKRHGSITTVSVFLFFWGIPSIASETIRDNAWCDKVMLQSKRHNWERELKDTERFIY